mmetsp:Transcript_11718/g.25751  ORF Transcript_11718/g.25751 Transcript_11718/m.25751 type:complete len:245 (+) Transcript_11718:981-1715(+)
MRTNCQSRLPRFALFRSTHGRFHRFPCETGLISFILLGGSKRSRGPRCCPDLRGLGGLRIRGLPHALDFPLLVIGLLRHDGFHATAPASIPSRKEVLQGPPIWRRRKEHGKNQALTADVEDCNAFPGGEVVDDTPERKGQHMTQSERGDHRGAGLQAEGGMLRLEPVECQAFNGNLRIETQQANHLCKDCPFLSDVDQRENRKDQMYESYRQRRPKPSFVEDLLHQTVHKSSAGDCQAASPQGP